MEAAEAAQATGESLDDVACAVATAVVGPGQRATRMRRDDRLVAEGAGQGPGLVALVGAVGQQGRSTRLGTEVAQELATPGRVARLTGREGQLQDDAVVSGERMELGRPTGAGAADRLPPPPDGGRR